MRPSALPFIEVAAGVIMDARGHILIARRAEHLHQGGLWEFPGGKLEPGETPLMALARELREELNVQVEAATPLITLTHDYPDRQVRLHVWRVECFSGEPRGLEGQPLRWVGRDALGAHAFPAANLPIVAAARLPDRYAILDEPAGDIRAYLGRITEYLDRGIRLLRLRASGLDSADYLQLARQVAPLVGARGGSLLVHGAPETIRNLDSVGLHLRTHELMRLKQRPIATDRWLAASCHDAGQLRQAGRIGIDFAVLGPVAPTATHPEVRPLGWDGFARLVESVAFPVFALGGLTLDDVTRAQGHGAQGIAGIRCFLNHAAPV